MFVGLLTFPLHAALQVPIDEPLMSAGVDSLAAVELRNSMQSKFGLELPPTVIFDFPSIAALAAHVSARMSQLEPLAAEADAGWHVEEGAAPAGSRTSYTPSAILAELQGIVSGMLGAEVAPDQPLMEAGLDSLGEHNPKTVWFQQSMSFLLYFPHRFPHASCCRCRRAAQLHRPSLRNRPARHSDV